MCPPSTPKFHTLRELTLAMKPWTPGGLSTTNQGPLPADPNHKQLHLQWTTLHSDPGHSHWHQDGSIIICQNLYGKTRKRTPDNTSPAISCVVDDMFVVWTHGEPQLQAFLDHLNSHQHIIRFTSERSREEVSYLDTKLLLEDGKIQTDHHCKLTDTHQYLQWSSCHPRHCKTSIPYSQALRLCRIC